MAANEEEIKIIYEDEALLVIDKPAGWVATVEKGKEAGKKFVENWVKERFPNNLLRRGIVHRLDKDTSGLLVIAKTQSALDGLKSQFKGREVEKKYLALVEGEFPTDAEINMPIGRLNFGWQKFGVKEDGKTALTIVKRVGRYVREGKKYSMVEVSLKTGRTHQIRVHLSYLRWPIVGDKLYGSFDKLRTGSRLGRQFLQAAYIRFVNPVTLKTIEVKSELPFDLVNELEKYEKV